MKSPHLLAPRAARFAEASVSLAILGHGSVEATQELIPALRLTPGPRNGKTLPASFLKHVDEQTVVGVGAVFHAIHDHALGPVDFNAWGILGAPRFMGRAALMVALQRYKLEGAWGISPHLIPHRSLHSVSGTVSQALAIHGPNFGVSGGAHAADEALLVAATLLAGDRLPGVWVVLTGLHPEAVSDRPNAPASAGTGPSGEQPVYRGVALALTLARPGSPRLRLHVSSGPIEEESPTSESAGEFFSLEALFHALKELPSARSWRLHCGGGVGLKPSGAGAEN